MRLTFGKYEKSEALGLILLLCFALGSGWLLGDIWYVLACAFSYRSLYKDA
jgi:hypothetical protein